MFRSEGWLTPPLFPPAAVRGEANRGSHVLMRITPPLLAALRTTCAAVSGSGAKLTTELKNAGSGSIRYSTRRSVSPTGAEYALVLGEQRPGADLGVAAVIRALGSDLGGYRPAGYLRTAMTRRRPVSDGWVNSPVRSRQLAEDRRRAREMYPIRVGARLLRSRNLPPPHQEEPKVR